MASTSYKEDDFSFPATFTTTTHLQPLFIGSPPLWQTTSNSPSSFPGTPRKEDGSMDDNFASSSVSYMYQRRSFSHVEDCKKKMMMIDDHDDDDDDDDGEEKMDMLWEDFNEESASRKLKSSRKLDHDDDVSSKGMVNLGCVQSLKLSKSRKKPSLVVFMKVLKKLFLLQNSHSPIKKRTLW